MNTGDRIIIRAPDVYHSVGSIIPRIVYKEGSYEVVEAILLNEGLDVFMINQLLGSLCGVVKRANGKFARSLLK